MRFQILGLEAFLITLGCLWLIAANGGINGATTGMPFVSFQPGPRPRIPLRVLVLRTKLGRRSYQQPASGILRPTQTPNSSIGPTGNWGGLNAGQRM